MIHKVELITNKERVQLNPISFTSGYNCLIGENGSGKSTILKSIVESTKKRHDWVQGKDIKIECDETSIQYFDSEKSNPRTLSHFGNDIFFQVKSMYMSHGEALALVHLNTNFSNDTCLLLDEPESGLDIGNIINVREKLVNMECQVIVATHHPLLMVGNVIELTPHYHQYVKGCFNKFI